MKFQSFEMVLPQEMKEQSKGLCDTSKEKVSRFKRALIY